MENKFMINVSQFDVEVKSWIRWTNGIGYGMSMRKEVNRKTGDIAINISRTGLRVFFAP
jgi:hypothetical protein